MFIEDYVPTAAFASNWVSTDHRQLLTEPISKTQLSSSRMSWIIPNKGVVMIYSDMAENRLSIRYSGDIAEFSIGYPSNKDDVRFEIIKQMESISKRTGRDKARAQHIAAFNRELREVIGYGP
jgi:hypothetical protein